MSPSPATPISPKTGRPLPTPESAREIALSHAHYLQIRKTIELSILTSLEELVDYPHATSTPLDLKCHLRYFQPSDFDSLMEEREICGKCGYPLCGNPRRRLPGDKQSKYVLVDKGKKSMRFVEATKLERFCGDECAKRGYWIRVQLSQEPAWTRNEVTEGAEVDEKGEVFGLDLLGERWKEQPDEVGKILLLEEAKREREVLKWNNTKEHELKKLARELHEVGINFDLQGPGNAGDPTVGVGIHEREMGEGAAIAPELTLTDENGDRALVIEGYTPKLAPTYIRRVGMEEMGG
jgi:hypothetical protein